MYSSELRRLVAVVKQSYNVLTMLFVSDIEEGTQREAPKPNIAVTRDSIPGDVDRAASFHHCAKRHGPGRGNQTRVHNTDPDSGANTNQHVYADANPNGGANPIPTNAGS
jgi:hypothetical protein